MKKYYGTKRITAEPMTKRGYKNYFNKPHELGEDKIDGYLIEYPADGHPNHPWHKGYISWSPKEVFEAEYQSTSAMNFGHALTELKESRKIAREGWNGKGLWIELQQPDVNSEMTHPYAFLNYSDGNKVPWVPSQTDMLANDWAVVE